MAECFIRVIMPSDWRIYRDTRLRALQDSPAAFATTYESAKQRNDEFWKSRLRDLSPANDLPLFAEVDGVAVGLAWGRIEPDATVADLFQMWVAPQVRRAGVGRLLVSEVAAWATQRAVSTLRLTVTVGNTAALRLYESMGFYAVGDPQPMRDDLFEQPMVLLLKPSGR